MAECNEAVSVALGEVQGVSKEMTYQCGRASSEPYWCPMELVGGSSGPCEGVGRNQLLGTARGTVEGACGGLAQ